MLTGKVIRFDEVRGYGFIAPDGGGEDVFVHANVLGDDKYVFGPGLRVEFEVSDGDRGPKAYAVQVLPDRGPAAARAPVSPPVIPPTFAPRGISPTTAPSAAAPPAPAPPPAAAPPAAASATAPPPAAPPAPAPSAPAPSAPAEPPVTSPPVSTLPAPAPTAPPATADSGDEEMCDVLTAPAFSQEITELLLKSAPTVTAAQILDMRTELINFGRRHGWIED